MVIGGCSAWVLSLIAVSAGVIDLLPDSPFNFDLPDYVQDILGYINYFVPIGSMIKILTAWTACIIVWYAASALMRWIKAIE